MLIAFEFSMYPLRPRSTDDLPPRRIYAKVVAIGRTSAAVERGLRIVADSPYQHDFGDGWTASVSARSVKHDEARAVRRLSSGFADYDWMIDSILEHGEIRAETAAI